MEGGGLALRVRERLEDGVSEEKQQRVEAEAGEKVRDRDKRPVWILQRHVRPLLHEGRKFHLRILLLCVGDLRAYVHEDVRMLLATEAFELGATDAGRHLAHVTNMGVNRVGAGGDYVEASQNLPLVALGVSEAEQILAGAAEVLGVTLSRVRAAGRRNLFTLPNCWELFGVDFLVEDVSRRPVLLEINASPSLAMYGSDSAAVRASFLGSSGILDPLAGDTSLPSGWRSVLVPGVEEETTDSQPERPANGLDVCSGPAEKSTGGSGAAVAGSLSASAPVGPRNGQSLSPNLVSDVFNPRLGIDDGASPSFVSDAGRRLSAVQKAGIDAACDEIRSGWRVEVAIVVLDSLPENVQPTAFLAALLNYWGVGDPKLHTGLVVLVLHEQRRLEMRAGFGALQAMPYDALEVIQRERIVPHIREGRLGRGLVEGLRGIVALLERDAPQDWRYDALAPPSDPNRQGFGGGQTDIEEFRRIAGIGPSTVA